MGVGVCVAPYEQRRNRSREAVCGFCVWETQDLCILKNPKHRYLLILFALSLVLAEESLSDYVSPAVWGSEVEQMGPQFSLTLTSVLFLPSTLFHNDQSKTFQRYVMGSESNKLGEPSAVIWSHSLLNIGQKSLKLQWVLTLYLNTSRDREQITSQGSPPWSGITLRAGLCFLTLHILPLSLVVPLGVRRNERGRKEAMTHLSPCKVIGHFISLHL